MKEIDVRTAVHSSVIDAIVGADPTSLVLDELSVCSGVTRIDIAVINGKLHGFELKSDQDNLLRLPFQVETFSKVFDCITLVVGSHHTVEAISLIPDWWGVIEIDNQHVVQVLRPAEENPAVDAYSLAQLLWKDELLTLLADHGFAKGFRAKTCSALWRHAADHISLTEINSFVRTALKSRQGWRIKAAIEPS